MPTVAPHGEPMVELVCEPCAHRVDADPVDTPPWYCPSCGARRTVERTGGIDLDDVETKTDTL